MIRLICALLLLPPQSEFKHPWTGAINDRKPDIVIIGNSMIGEGIDVGTLSSLSGAKVHEIRDNGQLTAWQYLVVKNVVGGATHVPKLVVVVERCNSFTTPSLRVTGGYKGGIDALRGGEEKVLDALAYGVPALEKDGGNAPLFWDFKANVDRSFLPHEIEVAKKKGFTLVVARHKSRGFADNPNLDTPQMKQYRHDLATYVTERGMVFLDYELEPAIKAEHYGNGSHLNRGEGRALWTRLMAEDLKALLAGRPAPHQLTGSAKAGVRGGACPVPAVAQRGFCDACARSLESAEGETCAKCGGKAKKAAVCVGRHYRCEADGAVALKSGPCPMCKKALREASAPAKLALACAGCGKPGEKEGPCAEAECKKSGKKVVKSCGSKEFPHAVGGAP